jgi:hypothetical protein
MKSFYKAGCFKDMAAALPHMRDVDDPFIQFLMNSRLLHMRDHVEDKPLTLGADPEFILCKKGTDEVVLYSSLYAGGNWNLSEAAVGADYGLLELRSPVFDAASDLIKYVSERLASFSNDCYNQNIDILKKEAVEFDHLKQRLREQMEDEKVDHGVNFHYKEQDIWGTNESPSIEGLEVSNMTISAYGKPIFTKPNPHLLSAGGHIHLGGGYVKMLSFPQLTALIRKIDQCVLPMCKEVETKAGELRRTIYGFPGEFRVKPYGFEYRSLSNAVFWPENMSALKCIMAEVVSIATNFPLEGGEI